MVKTETPSTRVVTTAGGGNHYAVTQTAIATATAVTTTTGSTVLGNTFACYSSPPSGTPTDFSCSGYSSCSYGGTTSAAACPSGARFLVQGNAITNQVVSNNTYAVPPTNQQRMTDEWARNRLTSVRRRSKRFHLYHRCVQRQVTPTRPRC